ncbi:hypothetical protein T02_4739 [Trichinella nativa]|uniref:Uncharacterized protein n=1 Tax=Trichinella nativa TaxID=6335 RepID=A0A0V1LB21_9BILA|nr:hypothetical protein T02_4739 [Trichinella nativa]
MKRQVAIAIVVFVFVWSACGKSARASWQKTLNGADACRRTEKWHTLAYGNVDMAVAFRNERLKVEQIVSCSRKWSNEKLPPAPSK